MEARKWEKSEEEERNTESYSYRRGCSMALLIVEKARIES